MPPNNLDQAQMMAESLGYNPFGAPGFGPTFGSLPPFYQMPPGSTSARGRSFFGPQTYSPHHLAFGSGTLGGLAGFGVESLLASRGLTYMPRGVSALDVLRGRNMEAELERAARVGREVDERNIARSLELVMKQQLGYTSLGTRLHSAALAHSGYNMAQTAGVTRFLPGGSASNFAQQVYLTGRNLRDYTRTEYGLGLPAAESRNLSQRLLAFFAPQGTPSRSQMRGLNFDDMGELFGTLSSQGLVNVGVGQAEMDRFAALRGLKREDISPERMPEFTEAARASNIGQQLQQYSEVIGVMRQIMGDPNAPIPVILDNLQQITGFGVQRMDPAQMKTLLNRIRETAAASNITADAMLEITKASAAMYESAGKSGLLGAQTALRSHTYAVAAQTLAGGPSESRLSVENLANIRGGLEMRSQTSDSTRTSVQVMQLLKTVDRAQLTPQQQVTYDRLKTNAEQMNYSTLNMASAVTALGELGIGGSLATSVLRSTSGVEKFLQKNPEALRAAVKASQQEMDDIFSGRPAGVERGPATEGIVPGLLRSMAQTSPNDTAVRGIQAAAAASGKTTAEVNQLLGRAIRMTDRFDPANVLSFLQSQGVVTDSLSGSMLQRIYRGVESLPQAQRVLDAAGVSNLAELNQVFGEGANRAFEALQRKTDVGVAGQQLVEELNLKHGGGTLERVMGSIASGHLGTMDVLTSALGFAPTSEIITSLDDSYITNLTEQIKTYQAAQESGDTDAVDAAKQNIQNLIDARKEFTAGGQFGGLYRTGGTSAILNRATPEVRAAVEVLSQQKSSQEERLQAVQKIIGFADSIPQTDFENVLSELPEAEAGRMESAYQVWKMEVAAAKDRLGHMDAATSNDMRQKFAAQAAGDVSNAVGGGLAYLLGNIGGLDVRLRTSEKGKPLTTAATVASAEEYLRLRQAFISGTPEDRQRVAGALAAQGESLYGAIMEDGPNGPQVRSELLRELEARSVRVLGEEQASPDMVGESLLRGFNKIADDVEMLRGMGPSMVSDPAAIKAAAEMLQQTRIAPIRSNEFLLFETPDSTKAAMRLLPDENEKYITNFRSILEGMNNAVSMGADPEDMMQTLSRQASLLASSDSGLFKADGSTNLDVMAKLLSRYPQTAPEMIATATMFRDIAKVPEAERAEYAKQRAAALKKGLSTAGGKGDDVKVTETKIALEVRDESGKVVDKIPITIGSSGSRRATEAAGQLGEATPTAAYKGF